MEITHSLAPMIASTLILASFACFVRAHAHAVSVDKTSIMKESCDRARGANVQMVGDRMSRAKIIATRSRRLGPQLQEGGALNFAKRRFGARHLTSGRARGDQPVNRPRQRAGEKKQQRDS